jgi:hypothetical protein
MLGHGSILPGSGASGKPGTVQFWKKLHIGMDADTGQIVASTLTDHDGDDGSQTVLCSTK